MDSEYKYGQTVQNTRDFGLTTKHMEKEDSFMLMEIYMKGNGWKTRQKDSECIITVTEQGTRESGCKTINRDMEWRHGQMEVNMKGSIRQD